MSFIIFKPTLLAWRSLNKISLQVILVPWEGWSLTRKLILMPPTVNGIFSFIALFFILFWIFSSFLFSTGKAYLEAPTFLPQLPNNLSKSGIRIILCGLQALVQVPQHALHRRIYCRPQKVPQVKGPQMPNTGPRFVPKVSTKTLTRFTQSSVRVSPYTEDGTAYDATRWFIRFSIHALSSLS